MIFSSISGKVLHKFIDISHQAVISEYFPVSVGLRSQALKLRFVLPETKGRFLKTELTSKKAVQVFENQFIRSLHGPVIHQSYIGEMLSLIYSPFYVEEKVYDAVLNKPVSLLLPNNFSAAAHDDDRPQWQVQFVPAICLNCGWDLQGDRDSLVLNCKNCNSAWRPSGKRLKKLKFAYMLSNIDNVTNMPFWRIKAEISGIELNSFADLIKIANLPKVVQKEWENIDFCFWVPAFKIRPKSFLRLGRNMTLSQPREKLIPELPDTRLHPVTLPVSEAAETLKTYLASFMKPQKLVLSKLKDIKINPKSYLLVYIPFEEKHHELTQPLFHLAINKNTLRFAGNL